MAINFDAQSRIFHLATAHTSYVIGLNEGSQALHLYWGAHLSDPDVWAILAPRQMHASFEVESCIKAFEYPCHGTGDYRTPAARVLNADGNSVTCLTYAGHEIYSGKKPLDGLPAVYCREDSDAETLELRLKDELTGLEVVLNYSVFEEMDVICRSARYENHGDKSLRLLTGAAASVDFFGKDYDFLHLQGAWARERVPERLPVTHGLYSIESRRGASGHQHNPFVALMSKNADEFNGDVYGFSFIYSGSFAATVEGTAYACTRVTIGLNPYSFNWELKPGESFQTPEAAMVYSDKGLNLMSQRYHTLYRTHLCRGKYALAERPILINNWEATYFGFNEEKIVEIARAGKEMGLELFVLDDGWFGKRDTDNCSLGDWVVDKKKLPNGLDHLAKRINELGMKFGLWFEPEMVSPDSDLYRAHPDWCIHVPGRARTQARQQLILDLSRADVCDYIIEAVSSVLRSAPISYVKWDMNRNMTEIGSALLDSEHQGEVEHRYMLGLYRVLETITQSFPDVLFESCSGGGGRFDAGLLYYMPQTWTSDDTDAIERLKIQYSTSMVYPISAIGSHVSAVPNHQTGRTTPMQTRCDVAMSGNFGFELDLSKLSEDDMATAKKAVELCKRIRGTVQQGEFTRLLSPYEGSMTAWQFVRGDAVILCYFKVLNVPAEPLRRIKMKGLDPDAHYRAEDGTVYSGGALMNMGYPADWRMRDFESRVILLEKV